MNKGASKHDAPDFYENMEENKNLTEKTIGWYLKNWRLINDCLTNLASSSVKTVYINNFEFMPEEVDQEALIHVFNHDSSNWYMSKDKESELIICKK